MDPMDDDDALTALLHRGVDTLEPRTDVLVAAGIRRGRQLRRRRRIAQSASGTVLTAMIAAGGFALWPSSPGVAPHVAPAAPAAPAGRDSAHPASPEHDVTPQVVAQRAIDLLPRPGGVSNLSGNSAPGYAGASFVYDDRAGKAKIDISLDYGPAGTGLGAACQISVCSTRPDGARLAVYQGSDHPEDPNAEPRQWSVTLARTDGVTITLAEWNAPEEKGAAPTTRPRPPFTIAEVTALVSSPVWTSSASQREIDADANLFAVDPPDAGAGRRQCRQAARR